MTQDREPLTTDEALSEAYRRLATERSPAALDARILAAARTESRTRYGLLRKRTRPLAWAAMIGLSLVIVLQVMRVPGDGEALPIEATSPATPEAARSRDTMPVVTEEATAAAAPGEAPPAPAAALPEKPGLAGAEPTDLPGSDAIAADRRQAQIRKAPASAFTPGLAKMSAPTDPAREGELAAPAASACSDSERATRESWLACIEALRTRGDTVAADAEYERLRAAFPDFSAEDPHK